jgi:hypothetical protein
MQRLDLVISPDLVGVTTDPDRLDLELTGLL